MKLQIATYKTPPVPEGLFCPYHQGTYVAQCTVVPWDTVSHSPITAYGETPEEATEKLILKVSEYHKVFFPNLRVVEVEI